jgi:hypothetical chaperone protein
MVPVAVGVDFGTSNSVVAIADRSGQVQVRRFDTQVGAVEAYRSALLFFREGRPPNATLGHISGPDALLRAMDIDADHRFLQSLKRTCRAQRYRTPICSAGVFCSRS